MDSILAQFQELIAVLIQLVLTMLQPEFLIPVSILILILVKRNLDYKKGSYYQATKLPYFAVKRDTGRYGEYLIYKNLKSMEANGSKFLFNAYIPKDNGETTEVDVLLITTKGVFVFESKNYSGWIFGTENQKYWYQTLPTGRGRSRKESFYNPILQNRTHIKHLTPLLGENVPTYSIITFSDRCTLKSLDVSSNDVSVIHRCHVAAEVSDICEATEENVLTPEEITTIYTKLYPYTQVSQDVKERHVAAILNDHASAPPAAPNVAMPPLEEAVPVDLPAAEEQVSVLKTMPDLPTDSTVAAGPTLAMLCPRCGGHLIPRTASRGPHAGNLFYGCSNYPRCRYTRQMQP